MARNHTRLLGGTELLKRTAGQATAGWRKIADMGVSNIGEETTRGH